MTTPRYVMGVTTLVLTGAIAGIVISSLLPRTYVSTANLFIESKRGSATDWISKATAYVLSRNSLRGIIESEGLYKRELERLPMEDLIEKMRRDIEIEKTGQVGTLKEIRVSFRHEDGAAAELTTRALMDRMISPGTAAEVLAAEPSWQPLSLETIQPPALFKQRGRGLAASARLCAGWRWQEAHEQITYAGVLRVRGVKSASVGAPDASELRNMVLDALKQQAYLESGAESVDGTMARMRRRLRFETGRLGDELSIFYSDASPARAQGTLANVVARVLESHIDPSGPVVEVFGPPSRPESYKELTPYTMTAAGAGLGLLLGLASLHFFSRRDRRA